MAGLNGTCMPIYPPIMGIFLPLLHFRHHTPRLSEHPRGTEIYNGCVFWNPRGASSELAHNGEGPVPTVSQNEDLAHWAVCTQAIMSQRDLVVSTNATRCAASEAISNWKNSIALYRKKDAPPKRGIHSNARQMG